jgi:tetratricopeptide (TPR) repeat protein
MRAALRSDKKEYDLALGDGNEILRLDPQFAGGYIHRGFLWYQKQEYDKAIADYDLATRLDPKDAVL